MPASVRESYATWAAIHTSENLWAPSENNSTPAERSASAGAAGAIRLSKNLTLQPLINFKTLVGSERDVANKWQDKTMFGASLSFSF
jgi:hypothetical protein